MTESYNFIISYLSDIIIDRAIDLADRYFFLSDLSNKLRFEKFFCLDMAKKSLAKLIGENKGHSQIWDYIYSDL